MNPYEDDFLSEQPEGYGSDFKPIKKKRRSFDPMTQRLNLFGEDVDDDLAEAGGPSAKVFAANMGDVLHATALANQRKLMQVADRQGRVPQKHEIVFRNSKAMDHVATALHKIGTHPKGEMLAKEALRTSTDNRIDGAQIMKTAATAGIAPKSAVMDYQRLVAMESVEEADGGMYHRSKRNRQTPKRGRGSAMAKDYEETQPDTLYNYELPQPQFSHDMSVDDIWESTEHREYLQFWLDEALEEHGFEDSYRSILRAIDEAVEEDDFETFDLEVARLCESLGILVEYKKMSGSARRAMMRARKKPKTGKEKVALKKRRMKYKRSAAMRRKAKMYRKRVASRVDSEDYEDNLTEQPAGYGTDSSKDDYFKPKGTMGMSSLIKLMGMRKRSKANESLDEQGFFGTPPPKTPPPKPPPFSLGKGGPHFDIGYREFPGSDHGDGGMYGSVGIHQKFSIGNIELRGSVDYGTGPFGGYDPELSASVSVDLMQLFRKKK
jgi:hypothetical protein